MTHSNSTGCGIYRGTVAARLYLERFASMNADRPTFDRFGTRLEQRFTRAQIRQMMEQAGFERITFSDSPPYWCADGYRSAED